MPYPNEHAVRIKDPSRFKKFARKTIAEGIDIILGITDSGSTTQAYRFDKDKFTIEQVREWIKKRGIDYISIEEASGKKEIKALINLQACQIQAFKDSEILELIPKDVLNEIKQKDPHPFFQVYAIAHEGISTPSIIGSEAKPIKWTRKAIQSIKNIITKGVKFFFGHNEDNSTDGREEYGEIVADTQKMINDNLHHLVVGYFPDKEKIKNLDICSQEAEWDLIETCGNVIADKIKKLTGIALCSSMDNKPAFIGAKRLGMIQAMEAIDIKGEKIMTFNEIKQGIRELNIFPSQIYSITEIKGDREFSPLINDLENKVKVLEAEKKQLNESVEKTIKEKDEIYKQQQVLTSKDRIEKIKNDLKLTEKQKKFVDLKIKEINDFSDESINSFIKNKLDEYKIVADVFIDQQKQTSLNDRQVDNGDLTKVMNNELLKTDL